MIKQNKVQGFEDEQRKLLVFFCALLSEQAHISTKKRRSLWLFVLKTTPRDSNFSRGWADMIVIYCSTFGLRYFLGIGSTTKVVRVPWVLCVQRDSHWLWRLGKLVGGDWLCELLRNYEYRASVSRSSELGTNTHPIFYTYGISLNQFTLVCSRSAERSSSSSHCIPESISTDLNPSIRIPPHQNLKEPIDPMQRL